MTGTKLPPVRIKPDEAITLFKFARYEEMCRTKELLEAFKKANGFQYAALWELLDLWDLMSLLTFVYDTGRVQGIREERAKRQQ